MSSEASADFAGKILADDFDHMEPVDAQIHLDADRLDITAGQDRYTIPLDAIHDTTVGSVTDAIDQAFPESLAVTYDAEGTHKRVVIGGSEEDISSFRTRLFTSIIGTQPALLKHPAKRGGRLTDADVVKMQLQLSDSSVQLSDGDRALTIDVDDVIGVDHEHREFRDTRRPTLAVDHTSDDATVTTFLTLPQKQDLTLLSQFIQLNYTHVIDDVSDLALSTTETQALVALYSAGGNAPLEMILTGENSHDELLQTLEGQNLVIREGDDLQLTSRGEVAVTEEIEAVNQ